MSRDMEISLLWMVTDHSLIVYENINLKTDKNSKRYLLKIYLPSTEINSCFELNLRNCTHGSMNVWKKQKYWPLILQQRRARGYFISFPSLYLSFHLWNVGCCSPYFLIRDWGNKKKKENMQNVKGILTILNKLFFPLLLAKKLFPSPRSVYSQLL